MTELAVLNVKICGPQFADPLGLLQHFETKFGVVADRLSLGMVDKAFGRGSFLRKSNGSSDEPKSAVAVR